MFRANAHSIVRVYSSLWLSSFDFGIAVQLDYRADHPASRAYPVDCIEDLYTDLDAAQAFYKQSYASHTDPG